MTQGNEIPADSLFQPPEAEIPEEVLEKAETALEKFHDRTAQARESPETTNPTLRPPLSEAAYALRHKIISLFENVSPEEVAARKFRAQVAWVRRERSRRAARGKPNGIDGEHRTA